MELQGFRTLIKAYTTIQREGGESLKRQCGPQAKALWVQSLHTTCPGPWPMGMKELNDGYQINMDKKFHQRLPYFLMQNLSAFLYVFILQYIGWGGQSVLCGTSQMERSVAQLPY